MISVLPIAEEQKPDFLISHSACEDCDCIYSAIEAGEELGWFSAKEENGFLTILQMHLKQGLGEEENFIAELLIRTAASYALNRYIPKICCRKIGYESVLSALKFEKQESGDYAIQLEKLIHKCANCQK